MTIPGPRQAAQLAAQYHELDAEIARLREMINGLTRQRTEREEALFAFAKENGEGSACHVKLVAGKLQFHLNVAEKRGSPSYKTELLKHISADELQRIVDEQPLKEKLELTVYPR